MHIPDNLLSIHKYEEEIRLQSLRNIDRVKNLQSHTEIIVESLNTIWTVAKDHDRRSQVELELQYLALRAFNSGTACMKLGFSGYYQNAFLIIRDIYEVSELIDYFSFNSEVVELWLNCDDKRRRDDFSPHKIRMLLDKRDNDNSRRRKIIYDSLSQYAAHATPHSKQLLAPNGEGIIGPFFDEKFCRSWIEELSLHMSKCAYIFTKNFESLPDESEEIIKDFQKRYNDWKSNYEFQRHV